MIFVVLSWTVFNILVVLAFARCMYITLKRWYSRSCTCIKANSDSRSTFEENASTSTTCDYCYCKQSIDSDLVGCDNSNCPIALNGFT